MLTIRRIRNLRGPNIWSDYPSLELLLDLGELKDRASDEIPGFNDRLRSWLPSLIEHRCSVGERGGFFQRLERGTYMAHILEHVSLELQTLAGTPVGFGRARETDEDGVYHVAIEYEEEEVGRACIETARRLLLAAVAGDAFPITEELDRLQELCYDIRLGPSTGAIARAARSRRIPVQRLNRDSLLQLGHGARHRRVWTAETDRTSAIAESIAQDKELTRSLLQAVGVPVPKGQAVDDADDAWRVAEEIGAPVVIKPRYGNHGRGVTTNLVSRDQVIRAYDAASEESSRIVCERYITGDDHRVLVIGDRMVAAALREPAQVEGDGHSSIRQLVEEVNRDPRRSDGHATVLSFIKIDAIADTVLDEQGYTPDSVPPAGTRVLLRRNGNLSTGGTATDVTDRVHPAVAAAAVAAARVVGLDIAGVDILASDISVPLEEQGGAIVEVNAGPGLRMHLEPSAGKARPVGEAVIDLLFGPGDDGRIPLVAVTGGESRPLAAKLTAAILESSEKRTGLAGPAGIHAAGRRIASSRRSGWEAARSLILNPDIEAAVLEIPAGEILENGLPFDRCHVGVVTDIGDGVEELGGDIDDLERLVRIERCVVEAVARPGVLALPGKAVLNADDPAVVEMAGRSRGPVIWFTADPDSEIVQRHRETGGRAVIEIDGRLVLAEGAEEKGTLALPPSILAQTSEAAARAARAATAAAWALDLPLPAIATALDVLPENG